MREDSSHGATLVILNMLLKFVVLIYNNNNDETWALHRFAKLRRFYCFGDRKTIKNSSAFVIKLSNHSLSFDESSIQAEIFLEAFETVMFMPGNWHTGMNMLQSIYKLFWTDLLKPLGDKLGWKRIAKDVRSCYIQASRLVIYLNNVTLSNLVRAFLSSRFETYEVRMIDDDPGNMRSLMAIDFQLFLNRLLYPFADEHLKLIVIFLLVPGEFLEFCFVLSVTGQYHDRDQVEVVCTNMEDTWTGKILGGNLGADGRPQW